MLVFAESSGQREQEDFCVCFQQMRCHSAHTQYILTCPHVSYTIMQFHLVTSLLFVLFFLLLKKKKKIEREYHLTFTCIIRYGRICPFSIHTHTHTIHLLLLLPTEHTVFILLYEMSLFLLRVFKVCQRKLNVHGFVHSASFHFMNKSVSYDSWLV